MEAWLCQLRSVAPQGQVGRLLLAVGRSRLLQVVGVSALAGGLWQLGVSDPAAVLLLVAGTVVGCVTLWCIDRPARSPMAQATFEGLLDRSTQLASIAALARIGDALLLADRARPATLAHFEVDDLRELETFYPPAVRARMLRLIGTRLRQACGRGGLAVRTGRHSFVVLFPGLGRQAAVDVLQAKLGEGLSFELEVCSEDVMLVPVLRLCESSPADLSVRGLMERCLREHSRPAPASAPGEVEWLPNRVVPPRNVPTIPAPLPDGR
ncbi:GGDEF domain-containing protein [Ramlibacter sp. AW1]|uniref:GGDEF domain-containing protein n=1 Tax=Ramlibacter aurantiacus TaxID=2801330 RepID=A0A936ZHN2_9BURK|nr:GGDEF domain-containing protein [Ramlibacter aurantiacus]MBL0421614.1 GGDEF domain-containing protein [Ramlibacter aurantiacus]